MRGRLVRIGGRRGDATIYAIAESDPEKALAMIRERVAESHEFLEDLGRVSDDLIKALNLAPGTFKKI